MPVWAASKCTRSGTAVKVVFCTSEFKSPDSEFVDKVQEMLDPVPYHQKGVGVAPIGHYVTTEGVVNKEITVHVNVTMKSGYTLDNIKNQISETITEYIGSVNKTWAETQVITIKRFVDNGLIIRKAKLESLLLDIIGVLDVTNLTLNGEVKNLQLGVNEIGKLKVVEYE